MQIFANPRIFGALDSYLLTFPPFFLGGRQNFHGTTHNGNDRNSDGLYKVALIVRARVLVMRGARKQFPRSRNAAAR